MRRGRLGDGAGAGGLSGEADSVRGEYRAGGSDDGIPLRARATGKAMVLLSSIIADHFLVICRCFRRIADLDLWLSPAA